MRISPNFRGPGLTLLSVLALASCNGNSAGVPASPAVNTQPPHGSKTFGYIGHKQTFKVPAGVKQLRVIAGGASGGSTSSGAGLGGVVKATIEVTPGETLAIFVGGQGARTSDQGGYNGGGNGSGGSGGGGGASDVRQSGDRLSNRVVVGGGGGGSGFGNASASGGVGGLGGGDTGGVGGYGGGSCCEGSGGGGGTKSSGGQGGASGYVSFSCTAFGKNGRLAHGGAGGSYRCGNGGGGGGGGYYGGGGGGGGGQEFKFYLYYGGGGGGGGGSSYVEKNAQHVSNKRGAAPLGDGQIVISW